MPLFDVALPVLYGYREDRMGIGPLVVRHHPHQRDAFALVYLPRRMVGPQGSRKGEGANDYRDNNQNLGSHFHTSKALLAKDIPAEAYHTPRGYKHCSSPAGSASVSDNTGDLNGSSQHRLEIC